MVVLLDIDYEIFVYFWGKYGKKNSELEEG